MVALSFGAVNLIGGSFVSREEEEEEALLVVSHL